MPCFMLALVWLRSHCLSLPRHLSFIVRQSSPLRPSAHPAVVHSPFIHFLCILVILVIHHDAPSKTLHQHQPTIKATTTTKQRGNINTKQKQHRAKTPIACLLGWLPVGYRCLAAALSSLLQAIKVVDPNSDCVECIPPPTHVQSYTKSSLQRLAHRLGGHVALHRQDRRRLQLEDRRGRLDDGLARCRVLQDEHHVHLVHLHAVRRGGHDERVHGAHHQQARLFWLLLQRLVAEAVHEVGRRGEGFSRSDAVHRSVQLASIIFAVTRLLCCCCLQHDGRHLAPDVVLAVVHEGVGAEILSQHLLVLAARHGDHPPPPALGQLHGVEAHRRRGAPDQHPVARLHAHQRIRQQHASQGGQRQSGGLREGHAVGDLEHDVPLDHHLLHERASGRLAVGLVGGQVGGHPLALQVIGSDLDGACDVASEGGGEVVWEEDAHDGHLPVDGVDGGRGDVDEDLAVVGLWLRDVRVDLHDVLVRDDVPDLDEIDAFHGGGGGCAGGGGAVVLVGCGEGEEGQCSERVVADFHLQLALVLVVMVFVCVWVCVGCWDVPFLLERERG
mmetsp:Transcript_22504/g.63780  ORF Transcript_22504/g.63780 Transcript_22504/m.63780 type:complete len:558 (-) Transcript_22504:391-2064(-)